MAALRLSRSRAVSRDPRPVQTMGAIMTVAERVLLLLAEATETDDVRYEPDLPLFELNLLDSLATVGLLLAMQRELGLQISPADLEREQWSTPRKLVADVERRLDGSRT